MRVGKSRHIPSLAWAVSAGLASGAVLCSGVAQAGDSPGAREPGFSFSRTAGQAESRSSYTRMAQLEWLFGGPQQRQPQSRAAAPVAGPGPANGGTQRYIYVPSRDIFGNTTYQRVLAPDQTKRADYKDTKADKIRQRVADKLRAAPPAPPTNGPLLITVSLARQQLTLYDHGVAIAQSPVSSGSRGHETPTGVFSVVQKQWWHRSNMYSSAPMPYMQRITWAGVALHAGELPGYPASHGCVRLPEDFAIRLWGTTQPGVRVIITHNEVKPVEIVHPLLFVRKRKDAPDTTPGAAPTINPPSTNPSPAPAAAPQAMHSVPADRVLDGDTAAAEFVGTASASLIEEMAAAVPAVAEIAIVRNGQGMRAFAPGETAVRPVANEDGGMRAQKITVLRGGEPMEFQIADMPPVTDRAVASVSPANERAADDSTVDGEVADILDTDDDRPEHRPRLALPALPDTPPVVLAYAGNDVMQIAARLQRRAGTEPQVQPSAAAGPPLEAKMLRPGPVSVFISRRQQRIYVRKGFEPVFDMAIAISNPEVPLGTHVFTANKLTENRDAFRWTVISLAGSQFGTRKASGDDGRAARDVLDRIQLPEEAVTRISEIVDVGATLIVTDQGPGRALSPDNDFFVVTRSETKTVTK